MTFLSCGGLAMPRSSVTLANLPIPSAISFVGTPPDITFLNAAASVCNRIIIIIIIISDVTMR